MELGKKIRKVRQAKGWTQNHLGTVADVPQPTIWRLENGLIRNPRSNILQRLAQALEVSADYLLREDEEDYSFDEVLRHDPLGKAIFRGYESLTAQGREQVKSFVNWLMEEERKRQSEEKDQSEQGKS